MKLIVGLGNPGKEYEKTRHNAGFMVIDNYVKNHNLHPKEKMNGTYYETKIGTDKIILLKPQSYINLSGDVIKKYLDYFKINIADIIIIHDDMDLAVGIIKLREKGGSAGHNGLNNIEAQLHTQNYKRVKIGISHGEETVNHVLGKFNKKEKEIVDQLIEICEEIITDFPKLTFENLMNKYN